MNNWERVNLLFSAGSRRIKPADELSLAELLLANRLPPSLFQAYEAPGNGTLRPIPITTPLSSVPGEHKVILQCIRNTDVDSVRANDFETLQRDPLPVAALFDFHYGKTGATNRVHLVDDDSLRQVVSSKIASFLVEHEITLPLVAGISGGGDSNTLVQGIRRHLESSSLVHLLHRALPGRPGPAAVDLPDARRPPAHDRPRRMARAAAHKWDPDWQPVSAM